MRKHRSKFLWPELTRYLLTQVEDVRIKMIGLLLLLDINYDPGLEMSPLTEIICARPQITKYLLSLTEIKHSPKQLLHILSMLSNIQNELALTCLNGKQAEWTKLAEQLSSKGGPIETKTLADVKGFYDGYVKDMLNFCDLDDVISLSKTSESRSKVYKHDLYQAAITGIIASQQKQLTLACIPTGSGKSYIIAMLALHYYLKTKKEILILVPNDTLRK